MRPNREQDLDAEICHHLRESAELLMAQGWDPEAAWREAERRFGDQQAVRDELDDIGRRRVLDRAAGAVSDLAADVRLALRGIARRPVFTGAVVVTLALGVGLATAVFAMIDAVVLRPMPYAEADRWMEVSSRTPERSYPSAAPEVFDGWREAGSNMADAWVGMARLTLVRIDGSVPEPLSVVALTARTSTELGIPMRLGRDFTLDDVVPGAVPVTILTRHYWERLGADPGILGTTLRLETGPVTVVGVLDRDVKVPDHGTVADLWVPLRNDHTAAGRDIRQIYRVWARRLPTLSLEAAQGRAEAIASALQEERPREGGWGLALRPLGEPRLNPGPLRGVRILAGIAILILLIALVNGVNLVLVRATARQRELAVRASVGCGRGRLARHLMAEGITLGALGAVGAILMAALALHLLRPLIPNTLSFQSLYPIGLERRAATFCLLAAAGAGTLLGLIPALRAPSLATLGGSRTDDDPPRQRQLRRALVGVQVALSMTLLAVAALFTRSMTTLLNEDPGFEVDQVALVWFTLPSRYSTGQERAEVLQRLEQEIERLPGVQGVGSSSGTTLSFGAALQAEGGPAADAQPILVPYSWASVGYLAAMGFSLERGRAFDASDAGHEVAVIDRDLETLLWGKESAVRRRFRLSEDDDWIEVVGVVRELRLMGRDQRDGPYQFLRSPEADGPGLSVEVAIRSNGDPGGLLPDVRKAIAEVDPWIRIHALRTASDALAEEEEIPRFLLTLTGVLAGVALALAAVGLYGVLSYSVSRRRREIGVRMALGADRGEVRRLVVLDGLSVASLGILLGLGGAWLASGLVESQLYEVGPTDPVALTGSAVLFMLVTGVAAWLPAQRATTLDPAEVLKGE